MQKLPADKGKRHQVNFRVTAEVRAKIAAAALRSGRSIAQELEARFEASLRNDDLQALIQKAVADGIATHEAAKREDLLGRAVIDANGSWAATNQTPIQLYRY